VADVVVVADTITASPAADPPGFWSDGAAIRRSYLIFPRWTQPVWTWLTGKPLPGEEQHISISPFRMMLCTLGITILASATHVSLLASSGWKSVFGALLTPVFFVVLTGCLRQLQVVYVHHAVHGTLFTRWRRANVLAANILTTLAIVQNRHEYMRDHLAHHSHACFTTPSDADAALLIRSGIEPGASVGTLRRALWRTLFSPEYHAWFLFSRLRSALRQPGPWCAVSSAWVLLLLIGLPCKVGLLPVALAIWLPLIPGYQMSALIQFLTEHLWLLDRGRGPTDRRSYAERCVGRFCGEMVVGRRAGGRSATAWLGWWCRTLFVYIPVRLGVLVGDLPAHDWHHLCGRVGHRQSEWPSAIYRRQHAIDNGHSEGMETRELWGIKNMINHVLHAMSGADPLDSKVITDQRSGGMEQPPSDQRIISHVQRFVMRLPFIGRGQ
jgi:hypothetical protein